ncbi:MAG TPA: hypothetical protein PKJ68_04535 [Candidatus Woesebacteria bacterium]|nr:hypothetical protein [Candidatus Woesebacteria bacterium]
MDEQKQAENISVEATNATESPAVEEKQVVESEASSEGLPDESQSVEQPPKKVSGAEKRIHKLVDERDAAAQEAETLRAKIAELTNNWQEPVMPDVQAQSQNTPANSESYGEERTLTEAELDRRIAQKASTIAQLTLERERMANRINTEAEDAIRAYPQLDPHQKDKYNPELNSLITQAVWLAVKDNPNQSVKKLVDAYMKPYLGSVEKAVEERKAEINDAVVSAALRPSPVPAPAAKQAKDMTIEELEAKLGKVR